MEFEVWCISWVAPSGSSSDDFPSDFPHQCETNVIHLDEWISEYIWASKPNRYSNISYVKILNVQQMNVWIYVWLSNITNRFTKEYICQETLKYLNTFEYSSPTILHGDSLTLVTPQVAGAGGRGCSHTLALRANTVRQIALKEKFEMLRSLTHSPNCVARSPSKILVWNTQNREKKTCS